MTEETRKRPWLAVVLAVIYPGLGHVYLRSWHRAFLWFLAVVLTATLFIPDSLVTSVTTPADVLDAASAVPTEAALAITLVAAFNVIDAYVTATRSNQTVEGKKCEHCGRIVDEDLDFCHWCTTPFDEPVVDAER